MSHPSERKRRRRRRREPASDAEPERPSSGLSIDRHIEKALSKAGLPDVGARVGQAVGSAIENATAEIERAARLGPRVPAAPPAPPAAPAPAAPSAAPASRDTDNFELLWGLLKITENPREERIEVLWGLLNVVTKRKRGRHQVEGADGSSGRDPIEAAIRATDDRMQSLRAACIVGSASLGFFYLSAVADAGLWRSLFGVGAIAAVAVAGGLLLSVFAERFRKRWLADELEQLQGEQIARREVAGKHALAMQELTASIAHEIRNPITAAKSLVQQMGEDPRSEENVEYADVALQELERVEKSVSHLLKFARDEAIDLQPVSLADAADSAVAALTDRSVQDGIEVQRDFDGSGPVSGDPEKLRRVFLNLIGNAMDALGDAETSEACVQVQLGANLAGTEVWARIRDNGPGIEPDRLGKIWSPFHTSKNSGTGLGLAITKKLVEAQGGVIEVSSTLGRGSEFLLTFPRRPEA